jgi:DNA/RNA-binding domain of Phe-tRNA-synthetase-like protein
MQSPPFPVHHELEGWALLWALLEVNPVPAEDLARLRSGAVAQARATFQPETMSSHPTVSGLRILFRAAGCDPTRYRPASEALLRRVLKGEDLPVIHPLVDLNNCLSITLAVPCCVAIEGSFTGPVTLRAGRPGESYESLKGPFNLEGKPILVDPEGPFDTPITGSQRVKVRDDSRRAWLTAYLPSSVLRPEDAQQALDDLLTQVPVVRVEAAGASVS